MSHFCMWAVTKTDSEEELEKIKTEDKTLILGGAKVKDKIGVIKNLLPTTSKVFVGGSMCATFLAAAGYNNFMAGKISDWDLNAMPNLKIGE